MNRTINTNSITDLILTNDAAITFQKQMLSVNKRVKKHGRRIFGLTIIAIGVSYFIESQVKDIDLRLKRLEEVMNKED